MTNLELIEQHEKDTMFCSFMGHMIKCSTTYEQIIAKGKDIVPDILNYLRNNKESAGMSTMLLLWSILKMSPYNPESVSPGVAGYVVKDAIQAWIDWGIKEKYIV